MISKRKHIFLLLLISLSCTFSPQAQAQNRSSLERKRAELLKEIEATSKSLAATRKDKNNTLNRYLSLQKQIQQRQALVDSYQKDIEFSTENIERTDAVITALASDLELLREEYSRIMRVALRHKLHQSYWAFLFSANSLNDAFQRWQYIRQYDQYRKRQVRLIINTQNSLSLKVKSLEAEKERKENLLGELLSQNQQLQSELNTKDELLNKLKSSEKKLVQQIRQKEKAAQELNAAIEAIIQAEIAAREAAAAKARHSEEEVAVETAASSSFGQARGRLPWPVKKGSISKAYGTYKHPKFKSVRITNNGIDITTDKNAGVMAVFGGQVAGTQFIPGYKNTVIIQHGRYYTVYSNLASIYVKRGDDVEAGQEIGKVGASDPEMHFEVWQDKKRLDPARWVVSR